MTIILNDMRKIIKRKNKQLFLLLGFCLPVVLGFSQSQITVDWQNTLTTSRTTPTLQVVYNPMLKRGSPIHEGSFNALKALGADYVRFVPWFPYPHAAVAELRPPTKDSTFWDFSEIDPVMEDFMNAQKGHSVMINFSTIPVWMFKTRQPVMVPSDPDQVFWDYNQGTELRDPSLKEVSDYFVRLVSWYTKGGFTDELGKFHKSDYHYDFQYWEVLNEPDLEHRVSPQLYTRIYDAVVTALKKIAPKTKFVAMALAGENDPTWFEYFLNHKNHKAGVPLDGISYHFYAFRSAQDHSIDDWQYSFFEKADNFLVKVKYIENIRKRLSPETFTDLNELGVILGDQTGNNIKDAAYWNLAGAMYGYLYAELSKIGIDIAGESQLVGYPTQFPSVSMMNWKNGKPNARYWVLKLIKDNLGPGDQLVITTVNSGQVYAQAFAAARGKKLLLINKQHQDINVNVPSEFTKATIEYVDTRTGDDGIGSGSVESGTVTLHPFSVTIISVK